MSNFLTRLKRTLKIGPGRKEVIEFADQAADSLSQEIATRAASWNFFSLNMYLPNPDPVLRKQGTSQTVYRDLLVDARIGAAMGSRKAGVLKQKFTIDQGQAQGPVFDLITNTFADLDLHRIMSSILDATFFGYSPLEIIWDPKTWTPKDVVGKPPEWFVFDRDNKLRFKTKDNIFLGIELDPNQFLCPTLNGTYLNPYGEPLAAKVFWPATFKKGSWRFWVTFTEKYGMPWVIGKHPRGADQSIIDRMADSLENMVQDAIAVIPEDAEVKIEQSGATANVDIYERLIAQANQEITTAILGHAGAGESTPGKLGGETGAMDVRGDLIDSDRRLVESILNKLIRIILDVNGITSPAPTFRLYEDEDIDLSLSERDEKLSKSLQLSGLQLTKGYYINNYGLSETDLESAPVPAQIPAPAFSEPDPQPIQKVESLEDQILRLAMFQEFSRPNGDGKVQDAILVELMDTIGKIQDRADNNFSQTIQAVQILADRPVAPINVAVALPEPRTSFGEVRRDENGRLLGIEINKVVETQTVEFK